MHVKVLEEPEMTPGSRKDAGVPARARSTPRRLLYFSLCVVSIILQTQEQPHDGKKLIACYANS